MNALARSELFTVYITRTTQEELIVIEQEVEAWKFVRGTLVPGALGTKSEEWSFLAVTTSLFCGKYLWSRQIARERATP